MNLGDIVSAYIHDHRDDARRRTRFFEAQPSMVEAIRNAIRPGGHKHSHQYRIPSVLLDEAETRLMAAADDLAQAIDFETLHRLMNSVIGSVMGIGPLTVYDLAHRVGAFLGKPPILVYLHSGTKVGAAALGFRGEALHPRRLPAAFSRLSAAEIEDCLCIYSENLRGNRRHTRQARRPNNCDAAVVRARRC